ncbi:hypothetical protein LJK88_16010 [Paenibacillus sp. P26]|nr:hypothetical protein LJK88_16010 [Paenibacillus sp. P26]
MGPVGAIFGSLVFTLALSHYSTVSSIFLAGVIPLVLSGLLMFGARSISPSKELEEISQ